MHGRADPAGPFAKGPGVARIAPLKDLLESAHHRARAIGIHNLPVFHFRFDAEVTLDAGNRVNDNSGSHQVPPSLLEVGGLLSSISCWMSLCLRILVRMAWAAMPAAVAAPIASPTLSAVVSMPKPGNEGRCR